MEAEIEEAEGSQIMDSEPGLDNLLRLEKGLQAPRWRERAEAARSAADALVKDGNLRQFGSQAELSAGKNEVVKSHDRVLRQLLHGLALKDLNWQVRVAAIEAATKILAAAKTVLPGEKFAEYVWVVLAACLDVQPEVQATASNSILQQLLVSSSHETQLLVLRLCDRFVEAAISLDTLPSKPTKLSTKSGLTGLDNVANGEILLSATTAATCLQLLPLPASDGVQGHRKPGPDRIPLLLVTVAAALEDASRRQNRTLVGELSKLLRSLGKPLYRPSLLNMFNVKAPVYIVGPYLARNYEKAGILNEDTANQVKAIKTVTILEGLSLAFEASHVNESWADMISRNTQSAPQSPFIPGSIEGEVIALQQIIEMLQVPDDLTKTLRAHDMELKALDFTTSAKPLLKIATAIAKNGTGVLQDRKLVEDLLLCCAAFAGGDGESGGIVSWTSKELRGLSIELLTCLADVGHPVGAKKVSSDNVLKSWPVNDTVRLISGYLASVLPRIKQVIASSSGRSSGKEAPLQFTPEGSLGPSIVAAYEMQWLLSQLEHPNLGPHCELVMPCVLTALDHFSPEVKKQAMRTCIHVAKNMNPTELRWYKDVTLDAVARSLAGCGDLWQIAVKMAVMTVTRIEGRNPRGSWGGRMFSEMLDELRRQQDDQNRRVTWLQEISPQMEAMGLVLVAHFKRLLPLLFYWLHAPDDLTCILTLKNLQIVITYTWPRIPAHVERIWKELMHTYQESRSRKASTDIQTAVLGICKLLYSCAGPSFEAVWKQDEEDNSIHGLVSAMKQLTTGTTPHM